MADNILELSKAKFEAFINLPAVKATYGYYRTEGANDVDCPRSLLGRRWIKYAGIYYVVGEADGNT